MIELTGGIPESWRLNAIRFYQYMYEPEKRSFVFEAENSESDEMWYIVFSGVSRISSRIPVFSILELAIENTPNGQYSAIINGTTTDLIFNSAAILSESEFELFENKLPPIKESAILSCLDR